MKAKLDVIVNKLISRKLMVFLIASGGLFSSKLDGSDWVIISAVYIGAETATGIVERLMKVKLPKQTIVTENDKNAQ